MKLDWNEVKTVLRSDFRIQSSDDSNFKYSWYEMKVDNGFTRRWNHSKGGEKKKSTPEGRKGGKHDSGDFFSLPSSRNFERMTFSEKKKKEKKSKRFFQSVGLYQDLKLNAPPFAA